MPTVTGGNRMKRALLIATLFTVCSAARAQTTPLSDQTLMSLRRFCNTVLIQLFTQDMFYVRDFHMNAYVNRETNTVVGLDVISINSHDPTVTHTCHFDFDKLRDDGTPNVSRLMVDSVPVNISVNVQQ